MSESTVGLSASELELLLEALKYSKRAKEDYAGYPSYEFKRARVAEVEALIHKLRGARS